jgi:hypothetical protein
MDAADLFKKAFIGWYLMMASLPGQTMKNLARK